jgi:hypothetical protein
LDDTFKMVAHFLEFHRVNKDVHLKHAVPVDDFDLDLDPGEKAGWGGDPENLHWTHFMDDEGNGPMSPYDTRHPLWREDA